MVSNSERVACSIASLHVHPVKSCAGVRVDDSLVIETGLEFDRAWMVVDPAGNMLTQRELPRMSLVTPSLRTSDMVLRAPGMLALHVRLDTVEAPTRVRIWDDVVRAYDMGALAAQWFSDCLGRPLRLVRFDPEERRLSDPAWAGDVQAQNAFSDGYPLQVANAASLDDLNRRMAARGVAPVGIERFRPNLVLDGLAAWDEDHLGEIVFETDDGPVRLRPVKPCVRCTVPSVDPATGVQTDEPGDTLAGFRADARVQGGLTFGVNAVVLEGCERTLRAGQRGVAQFAF